MSGAVRFGLDVSVAVQSGAESAMLRQLGTVTVTATVTATAIVIGDCGDRGAVTWPTPTSRQF